MIGKFEKRLKEIEAEKQQLLERCTCGSCPLCVARKDNPEDMADMDDFAQAVADEHEARQVTDAIVTVINEHKKPE